MTIHCLGSRKGLESEKELLRLVEREKKCRQLEREREKGKDRKNKKRTARNTEIKVEREKMNARKN